MHTLTGRLVRRLAISTLALAFVFGGAVASSLPSVSAATFSDIGSSKFKSDIVWLADQDITAGCGGTRFCPKGVVTRAQMATFLTRALDLPEASRDYFRDDEWSIHEDRINRLAEAGITHGCADGRFCPNGAVRRDQMASFLARALDLPSTSKNHFRDDNDNKHESNINRLAASGITRGCDDDRFCPGGKVLREQMAAFLHRSADRLDVTQPATGRCSTAMAKSEPAGWTRRVTSRFNETTPLGSWPGPKAAEDWRNRAAGAKDSSGRGTYDSRKTVSERNGVLDIWVHSEAKGQTSRYHNLNGNMRYVAAPIPTMGHKLGQRISMCMRADVIPGYKAAILLWPEEGPGNYWGEIDFPEGRFNAGVKPFAFMHYAPKPSSGKHQDWFQSTKLFSEWHVYTLEWNPRASTPYVKFWVDGKLIGKSTKYIPPKRMQLVLQIETWPGNDPLPAPAQGHVKFDWITIATPG